MPEPSAEPADPVPDHPEPANPEPANPEPDNPEDRKIVTLARSARARTRAAQGACVRDLDGRTYAGVTVDLPSLRLTAVEVAVAMAVASGAAGLEAVAVVGDGDPLDGSDVTVVRDFAGEQVTLLVADASGAVVETAST